MGVYMGKRLFLILFSAFIGIFGAPEILMASDDFSLTGLNNAGITETVPIVEETPESESEPELEYMETTESASAYVAPALAYEEPEPVYIVPSDSISIVGRTLEIVDVADTTVDAGNHVNKYGDRFLYGHNSAGVFGGLTNLDIGSTFTMTYSGNTVTYRVAKIVVFEKNAETGRLQIDGAGNYMRSVANAKNGGVQYDLSLMTCCGTSYGNGDASHRLVIFANAL